MVTGVLVIVFATIMLAVPIQYYKNHADEKLGLKLNSSLGRKQEIIDSLGGGQIWSENWWTSLYPDLLVTGKWGGGGGLNRINLTNPWKDLAYMKL